MKKEDFLTICRAKAKKPLTEEEESFLGSIGEAVEKALNDETVERNKKLTEIETKLGTLDEGKTFSGVVRELATLIDNVEKKSKRTLSDADKFCLRNKLEEKKDEILSVVRKEATTPWSLEFKARRAASALMQTSTVLTGAVAINTDNVFDDMEITVIRYPANFIGDAINSRMVGKVPFSIKWKEQIAAGDGVVTKVSEGETKPLTDKKFTWKYAYRDKYAGRIEFTEETEIDFEQLMLDIIDMFESDVLRAYNDGILAAILAWAPTYTGTVLDGTLVKPTIINVVNAGKLQVSNSNYTADILVINPGDYAGTQNMQNVNGDPIFVPDTALFPGLRVFVTNKITVGTCLIGESAIIKEQHGSYILRSGQYGNQLIENEKTIIGEIFSVIKLPTESKKGWVKLEIATVLDALAVPQN